MTDLFVTQPSPFPALPKDEAFRIANAISSAAEQYADAQFTHDLFLETAAQAAAEKERMFSTFIPGPTGALQRVRRLNRIYARAFIFAIDNFIKQLEVLSKDPVAAPAVAQAVVDFKIAVPGVVDVRDSLHHLEDRGRGLDRRGDPLPAQPVNVPGITVETGASVTFVGTAITGNTVGSTVGDGHFVQVEVSVATLQYMIDALQAVIDAFPWDQGPGMRWPRAAD